MVLSNIETNILSVKIIIKFDQIIKILLIFLKQAYEISSTHHFDF